MANLPKTQSGLLAKLHQVSPSIFQLVLQLDVLCQVTVGSVVGLAQSEKCIYIAIVLMAYSSLDFLYGDIAM